MSTTAAEKDRKDPGTVAPFTGPDRLVPRTLHLLEEVQSVVRRIGGEDWYTAGHVDERGTDTPTLTRLGMGAGEYAIDLATRAHEELYYMEVNVPHPTGSDSDVLYDAGRALAAVTGALEGIVHGQPDIPLYHIAWGCTFILDREIERIRARMEEEVRPPRRGVERGPDASSPLATVHKIRSHISAALDLVPEVSKPVRDRFKRELVSVADAASCLDGMIGTLTEEV